MTSEYKSRGQKMPIEYFTKVADGVNQFELWSSVEIPVQTFYKGFTWGGGKALNYVCSGSLDYCKDIKERLEND